MPTSNLLDSLSPTDRKAFALLKTPVQIQAFLDDMSDAIDEARFDTECKAILVRSASEKFFSAVNFTYSHDKTIEALNKGLSLPPGSTVIEKVQITPLAASILGAVTGEKPITEGVVALLERRPRFQAMGVDAATIDRLDYDQLNAMLRAQFPQRTLAETRATLRATHERMLQTIERMAEADLFEPYSYYQPDAEGENSGNPVIGWIVGNGSEHYREHLGWMRAIAAGGPPTPTG